MARIFAGDLNTGIVKVWNIATSSASCTTTLNGAGTITAAIPLPQYDPSTGTKLDITNLVFPGRSYLAYEENGTILNAGPIWSADWDNDTGTWNLNAAGIRSYWDHRFVLPALANPEASRTARTSITGVSLRTAAKRLVAQAQAWTSGSVPMLYPEADETGTVSLVYDGYAMHRVGDALNEIVTGGPDIDFRATFTAAGNAITWSMVTGTPELTQGSTPGDRMWNTAVPYPTVKALKINWDATTLVTDDYEVGATPDPAVDTTTVTAEDGTTMTPPIIGAIYDTTLPGQNYLRMEASNSQSTLLDKTALEATATSKTKQGRLPAVSWQWQTFLYAEPKLGQFNVGDYARITFKGNPIVPDGTTRLRIVSIQVNEGDQFATVTGVPDRTLAGAKYPQHIPDRAWLGEKFADIDKRIADANRRAMN